MPQLTPDIEVAHYSLTQKVEESEEGPVRCTLCYEVFKIPKQGPGIPLQDPVLILCPTSETHHTPRVVAYRVTYTDLFYSLTSLPLISHNGKLKAKLCQLHSLDYNCGGHKSRFSWRDCSKPDVPHCDEHHRLAHCLHIRCWKLVNLTPIRQNLNQSIYNLKKCTEPLYRSTEARERRFQFYLDDIIATPETSTNNSAIGSLLAIISRLPAEIRTRIANQSQGATLARQLAIRHQSQNLLKSISTVARRPRSICIPLDVDSKVLTARWINLYGEQYMFELATSSEDTLSPNTVSVQPLRGIKFAVGLYGIKALKLLHQNGSESNWLGKTTSSYIGTSYGTDITGLLILQDALKYIRIDLEGHALTNTSKEKFLWGEELLGHEIAVGYTLEFSPPSRVERVQIPLRTINHFSDWRPLSVASFIKGRDFISGITMYYCIIKNGLVGVVTNYGNSHSRIGFRTGCAIHLPLRKGEHIISIWFHEENHRYFNSPALMMKTNMQRSQTFSPVWNYGRLVPRNKRWEPLHKDITSPVTSIFCDALRRYPALFGVVKYPVVDFDLQAPTPTKALPTIPVPTFENPLGSPDGRYPFQSYLSYATLQNVAELRIWRKGPRYMGLFVQHTDGMAEVLGQWDPSLETSMSVKTIYEKSQGDLQFLSFISDNRVMTDIHVGLNNDQPVLEPEDLNESVHGRKIFHYLDLVMPLAWCFSERYDAVIPWNGSFEVPVLGPLKAKKLMSSRS